MFEHLKEKNRKNKLLKEAFKQAGTPLWFVFYESNDENGSAKVYASTEHEAREKANFMISDILQGRDFVITGTAAI